MFRGILLIAALLAPAVMTQGPGAGAQPERSDLAVILRHAARVAEQYGQDGVTILADEVCEQRGYSEVVGAGAALSEISPILMRGRPRRWKAELALILTPEYTASGYPWAEYRDVFEVDDTPIADRRVRLEDLFLNNPEQSLSLAKRVHEASARFNIGPGFRSLNTPAVPLLVLHPANQQRFSFSRARNQRLEGTETWVVEFAERTLPTLMQSNDNSDAPAHGTFWLDPATGEVVRAHLRAEAKGVWSEVTTTYLRPRGMTMRLPSRMIERTGTERGSSWVEGRYEYSNFRRFQTGARIVLPKDPR